METSKGPQVIEEAKTAARSVSFNRALSDEFIRKLATEATKGGWWTDVLANPDLFIAARGGYLNVYSRGQSLFLVAYRADKLTVTTHPKFLLDPALEKQVPLLENGSFEISSLQQNGFFSRYGGSPAGATLDKIKRAAQRFAGLEKIGCHQIAVNNKNCAIIDCEIQFPEFAALGFEGPQKGARADMACLEPHGSEEACIVFWEAKHYTNGDLKTRKDGQTPVCDQVVKYKKCILYHRDGIIKSYQKVAENLVALEKMGSKRGLADVIRDVASKKRKLVLDEPEVGLVIFGFDEAQRDHGSVIRDLKNLQKRTRIFSGLIPRGNAGDIVLTTKAS